MKKVLLGLVATVTIMLGLSFSANAQNPYDYMGKMHNSILDKAVKSGVERFSEQEIVDFVSTNLKKESDYNKLTNEEKSATSISSIKNILADSKNNYRNIIAKSGYSTEGKKLLTEMFEYGNKNVSLSQLLSYLRDKEQFVQNSSTFSKAEKVKLLKTISIYSNSSKYWFNKASNFKNSNNVKGGIVDAILEGIKADVGTFVKSGSLRDSIIASIVTFIQKFFLSENDKV